MAKLIDMAGNVAAMLGIFICLASGMYRLMGNWEIAGYSTMTLLTLGIGLMVFACLAKLHVITNK